MTIEPVAYFKSPFASKFGIPRQSGLVPELKGEIHFTEKYRRSEAVRGLEGFDYIWLIWEFSAGRRDPDAAWQPTVRPPRLGGNARLGVFATRSPFRPNPLGLSCVRLERIDFDCPGAPVIHVLGADLMDGTPVYDIKPYIPYADAHPEAAGGFTDSASWTPLKVRIPDTVRTDLELHLGPEGLETLIGVLALDPRPRYQDDPGRIYGMPFCGLDIRFKAETGSLTVTGFDLL
jgi:tRNA-Thr(GGU) m(6)t(6)A37 methyltransferase TsaA